MSGVASTTLHGEVAVVTIDSPPVNTMTREVRAGLKSSFESLRDNREVKAIVLACAGRTFLSGGDMREFDTVVQEPGYHEVLRLIEDSPVPVVAALHGTVMGGGVETALACHYRVAADITRLGLPEITLGIIPGAGGTQRLPRVVGKPKAMELLMTGDTLTAAEALQIGLVCKVVPAGKLMAEVESLCQKLLAKGAVALQMVKEAALAGLEVDLGSGLEFEAKSFAACFATDDRIEGVKAFLEKRKPVFKGR
jgi:enoyl-CoA hydratase